MVLQSGHLTVSTTLIRLGQYHCYWKPFFLKQNKKYREHQIRIACLNGSIKPKIPN